MIISKPYLIIGLVAGCLWLNCGSDKKPEPKQIGVDTLTVGEKAIEFAFFPVDGRYKNSASFIDTGYLEIPSLDFVYTIEYQSENDTFGLFMTHDFSGVKYINFRAQAGGSYELQDVPVSIIFDDDYGFKYEHPKYGTIIAGLKNNRLVGILGLDNENQTTFFSAWLASLPVPEVFPEPTPENK